MSANILEKVGDIFIPATSELFVAKEKFVLNTDPEAGVLISHLSDNFNLWFGNKIEEPIGEQTLCCHKLLQSSMDVEIIDELGGEAKVETTLSELHFLMEGQKHGESGDLLNNSRTNKFYIKDVAGVLRAVHVYWYDDGWHVLAFSVEGPGRWGVGYRVLSRYYVELQEPLLVA